MKIIIWHSDLNHGICILVGNSENVEHAWRKIGLLREEKKNPICDCSRSNQLPWTDKISKIALLTCAPISALPSNLIKMDPILNSITRSDIRTYILYLLFLHTWAGIFPPMKYCPNFFRKYENYSVCRVSRRQTRW